MMRVSMARTMNELADLLSTKPRIPSSPVSTFFATFLAGPRPFRIQPNCAEARHTESSSPALTFKAVIRKLLYRQLNNVRRNSVNGYGDRLRTRGSIRRNVDVDLVETGVSGSETAKG